MTAALSVLSPYSRQVVYYTTTAVWLVFLALTSFLFYRFRRHPAIQHRDVALTMVSITANTVFSVHYLVKIPLAGNYPCALHLWIPIAFMPLWLMTLLARLTRIIAAYRLGEARLYAVEQTQDTKLNDDTNTLSPLSHSTDRRSSIRHTVNKLLRTTSTHEPMMGRRTPNSIPMIKKKASSSSTTACTFNSNQGYEERSDWPGSHEHTRNLSSVSTENDVDINVVVDPDRAYATLTSPRSAHWTFVYRQHLTTPSLVRMIIVLELIILIGAVFFHYMFRDAFFYRPDGSCGSSPTYTYIWVVAGIYLVLVTPALIYAARDVHDAWGIRNELVLCDIIGIISCILFGIFRIDGWGDDSTWPAALWILWGASFTHVWTVARPAIRAACDLRDIKHYKPRNMSLDHVNNTMSCTNVPQMITPQIRRIPSSISHKTLNETSIPLYLSLSHPTSPTSLYPPPPSPTTIPHLNAYRDRIASWQPTPIPRSSQHEPQASSITLDNILACPDLLPRFRSFCMHDLSLESLLFYETVTHLQARITGIDRAPRYDPHHHHRSSPMTDTHGRPAHWEDNLSVRQSYLLADRAPTPPPPSARSAYNFPLRSPTLTTLPAAQPMVSSSSSPPSSPLSPSFNMTTSSGGGGGGGSMTIRRPPLSRAATNIQLRNIVDAFIRPGAPYEVPVSTPLRERLLQRVDRSLYPQSNESTPDIMESGLQHQQQYHRDCSLVDLYEAANEIRQQLEDHSVVRFRQEYIKLVKSSNNCPTTPVSRWRQWIRVW
ncbi:hypothetical protein BDF19DRAFT_190793 [Syncephalis fuscata]|nr:hypothetical protein BDF19DRAFT_190793 [Syncephalis fuscata]